MVAGERRVALVTGANHGIGAATAAALAGLGIDVAVTYLRLSVDEHAQQPPTYAEQRGQAADATVAAVQAAGARAHAIEADLADPDTPRRVLDEVDDALGPVSILVH